jgi:hypothetical protein
VKNGGKHIIWIRIIMIISVMLLNQSFNASPDKK